MAKKILGGGAKLLGLGGGKKRKQVETPTMPAADDEAVKRAKRRSLMKQKGRGGRASTILTDGEG